MPDAQKPIPPVRCPRCGGIMYKPAGSNLYWHADSNHPPCTITNLVDTVATAQTLKDQEDESSTQGKARKTS
jgi:hypothetical protein